MQLIQIDNKIELGCVTQKVNTFLKMALIQKRMTDISSFLSDHITVSL